MPIWWIYCHFWSISNKGISCKKRMVLYNKWINQIKALNFTKFNCMNDLTVQAKFIKCPTQETQAEEIYLNQSIVNPFWHKMSDWIKATVTEELLYEWFTQNLVLLVFYEYGPMGFMHVSAYVCICVCVRISPTLTHCHKMIIHSACFFHFMHQHN